jgi:hypothetical protein
MQKFTSSSVAKKIAVFAAVVGVTGALAGTAAFAQSGGAFVSSETSAYTKNQCKDGGWETNFASGTFKNQGDCVSFFAKGGNVSELTAE